jgi:Phycobilisome degradation protein nblA
MIVKKEAVMNINMPTLELSLEQQFSLMQYEKQITALSKNETHDFLLEVLRQLMIKDNVIRSLMKSALG